MVVQSSSNDLGLSLPKSVQLGLNAAKDRRIKLID